MISGVILAAGFSRRMGRPKLLVPLGGRPILSLVVDAFEKSRLDELLVVTNNPRGEEWATVKRSRFRLLVNLDSREGMSTSLKLALGAVEGQAAVIGMGDQPLLLPSTIDKVIAEYQSTGGRIVVPVYRGQRGNPVLFDRSIFPQIMDISGDVGAKSVVLKNLDLVHEVNVNDEGILLDIDTPSDLAAAERILARRSLHKGEARQ
jgi:molybdenum cofactor cytidylyltransferase